MQYDVLESYTELTRQVAAQLQETFEIETELSRLTTYNSAVTSLSNIRKCLLALFEGNLSVKKGDQYSQKCPPKEVLLTSLAFFESWQQLFPKQMANRNRFC